MGHKFEVFSGGCELCKNAIELLRDNVCEKCEIIEYNLQNPIQEKIEKYEINVVPTIIVDEEHKYTGVLKTDEIKKIIEDG
jgi:predicted DsbA family dithiol-disulfide isomerase